MEVTDLERDQDLYDLSHLKDLDEDTRIYYGGHNLVRIYDSEGASVAVMTNEEFEEFLNEVQEIATRSKFRDFMEGMA